METQKLASLVLLPGNSPKNKTWIEAVRKKFEPYFSSIITYHYSHWGSGAALIDTESELKILSEKIPAKNYFIFAKSAGAIMILRGIYEKTIGPNGCIFIGLPVPWSRENGFDINTWISDYNTPTFFIQQVNDPAMPFADLKNYLIEKNVKNYILQDVPGADHDYSDIDLIRRLALDFISNRENER